MMKFATSSFILLLLIAQIKGNRLLHQVSKDVPISFLGGNCHQIFCIQAPCPDGCPCVGCKNCPNGFNDGCNDCMCGPDGIAACTKKACKRNGEPFCKPDCSTVKCASPICDTKAGEVEVTPAGSCCATCKIPTDCSLVFCDVPNCPVGGVAMTIPGECCPVCVPQLCPESLCVGCDSCPNGYNDGCNDCTCGPNGVAKCGKKACLAAGQPFCKPDCSATLCAVPNCAAGEKEIRPAGECCSICVRESFPCPAFCPLPSCGGNEVAMPLPGRCCATCVPGLCDATPSEKCDIEGQEYSLCGSACTPTCDNPNPICTLQCIVGICQCRSETPILGPDGVCITIDECPDNKKQCLRSRNCARRDGYGCKPEPKCNKISDLIKKADCSQTKYCLKTITGPIGKCQTDDDCVVHGKEYECNGRRCTNFQ